MLTKFTIRQFSHRPRPFKIAAIDPIFIFHKDFFRKSFQKTFKFTDSCRYFTFKNQDSWNKLYGFCLGIRGIHRNSFRIVWRYIAETDNIEIAAYYYMNGKGWEAKHLKFVELDDEVKCDIRLTSVEGHLRATFTVLTPSNGAYSQCQADYALLSNPRIGFGCGLYFGGRSRAPHNIVIFASKKTGIR